MKAYKNLIIKMVLVFGIVVFLGTEPGKSYADDVKPLIQMILQQ